MTTLNGFAEFEVNSTTSGDQRAPIIANVDGGFVVAWQSSDGQGDLLLQRYTDAGAAVGGEVTINTTTVGDQAQASITATADGGFVVAWASDQGGSDYDVFLQQFDAQAHRIGG